MTEVVDKTLIERLILEHSDRLELEINQKARADAWKFYYRVRVDHVIRPFAVCKVCFRVLHCDSRSGTASLLRHPCNPLSERSPVNRAVKLSAKLNLPVDTTAATLKAELKSENYANDSVKDEFIFKGEVAGAQQHSDGGSARSSPVSLTTITSRASPTSTGSPPTAAQPTTTATASVGSRKRKTGNPPPSFPIDLRFLQLPQLVAAAAAHPLTALNIANATALFADPQRLQHLQQQLHHSHLEHIHRQQQQQQREREREEQEAKRARFEVTVKEETVGGGGDPGSPEASSSCWGRGTVKKERADTSDSSHPEDLRGSASPIRYSWHHRVHEDSPSGGGSDTSTGGLTKEVVQQLVSSGSSRVTLTDKDSGGSHYISDVWVRFSVVCVDGVPRPFAACKSCLKVVTYTKYSGTGGLLRHRCSSTDIHSRQHEDSVAPTTEVDPRLGDSPPPTVHAHSPAHAVHPISPQGSPLSLSLRRDSDGGRLPGETPMAPNAAMAGVARALVRYMCQDLVAASSLDSNAFQRLVWTILNLGAAHGTFREEEPLPSARQLLNTYLTPMAGDSRSVIARSVLDQTNLCLSLHHNTDLRLLSGAIHFITPKFELRSYALGAHRVIEQETEDEAVTGLLSEFFSDVWVPAALRDKHVTVVSDRGTPSESGVVGVRCVWHAVEEVLDALTEEPSYRQICDDVAAILSFLADSDVSGVSSCGLQPHEVKRWDALLHALNFITGHHDELCAVMAGCEAGATLLGERRFYQEVSELLTGVKRCLLTVRDSLRPTLNQAVLCRAKLLQLCAAPSASLPLRQLKQHLASKFTDALALTPFHHVASFLDPRCKSLKVLTDTEKTEVHRHVLEMMKSVAVTEANTGVLNLKTTRTTTTTTTTSTTYSSSNGHSTDASMPATTPNDVHPFREYMDNPAPDTSVSDSEEIMAYVNMKVHLEDDDILGWWSGTSASGLSTLRLLARKILAVPATCAYAHDLCLNARQARQQMGIVEDSQLNNVLHLKYNMN
ncbi:LOW QUALITY PROTEIN: uncharacterized protein LOC135206976 [Macrobrachium nipponense]|uniref:LOW QUALITY PROTEIN: uncharacterized protein LOC135206976 n=1 Tax=Macrobrachium nipponense TaxID=159736 RepID=UPI0030C88CA0